eukprot:TRINITY_DN5774_c0_g1_i6.p1 TRINITY_DN5774_c0_g1~~TRINITY_DN5774_c0_g1_i6.p1  ORF type:complete len:133 (-),score=20.16 TRINITY_DN5774_c0_g1_i6:69-467(-)
MFTFLASVALFAGEIALGYLYPAYETLNLLGQKSVNQAEFSRLTTFWIAVVLLHTFINPIFSLLPSSVSIVISFLRLAFLLGAQAPALPLNSIVRQVLIENEKLLESVKGILRNLIDAGVAHVKIAFNKGGK